MADRKFPFGSVLMTPGAAEKVDLISKIDALKRHGQGDWGDLSQADKDANDRYLKNDERLLSVYKTKDGTVFWIITEWDRSVTTILLPEEY